MRQTLYFYEQRQRHIHEGTAGLTEDIATLHNITAAYNSDRLRPQPPDAKPSQETRILTGLIPPHHFDFLKDLPSVLTSRLNCFKYASNVMCIYPRARMHVPASIGLFL